MGVFIIAEAGVNHNGDADRALRMIDVAAEAGADAIKFQTFSADRLAGPTAAKADYQARETGGGGQHEMLKALEMSDELHRRLFARCTEAGIEFMSTPFDEEAADFLAALGMRRLKVPSGEVVNHPFLRHLAAKGLPMIVSTGMATMDEVREAADVVREGWGGHPPEDPAPLSILHCTSNYPAAPEDVNLRAMTSIADTLGVPVGYSDHTLGAAVSIAAVARGAVVIEKHFTLDRALPGPDHRASLTPEELKDMVMAIRAVEAALGSDVKAPTEAELAVRQVARRSVTAMRSLAAGAVIEREDVALLRPATGIPPKHLDEVVGRRLARPVEAGTPLQWDDLA
ncbi:MAG TPA: N-acetylneuraminate synthase [Allosphingosinicella sp.]|uniref:N-acetylneuraminate synthase n=1 Tax=Allosphingosinicella sp. TaxID=2823234 RepID=UPI002EDAC2F7